MFKIGAAAMIWRFDMKNKWIILCCVVTIIQISGQEMMAFYFGDVGVPGANEVHIGKTGIVMPVGKILLARKNTKYCAVIFTKFWSENTSEISSLFVASGADEY